MKRVLFYNVTGQQLSMLPEYDYKGIVRNTKNYLYVYFKFDETWAGMNKVLEASNEHDFSNSHAVAIVNETAMIPNEVTDSKDIYIRVHGMNKGVSIVTNKVHIEQT